MRACYSRFALPLTTLTSIGLFTIPAFSEQVSEEIIVTARKRDETSISVPVVLTAVTAKDIARRGINGMDGIARLVPQLIIGEGSGATQGGNIVLRGLSGGDTNPFADQAVSFNIDGVQIARSSVRRIGEMDIAQVEVLKGPQALYFGKNSPGGIISVRTADPTQTFEAGVNVGYEFYGREARVDGYISGPITKTLGARFAFYGSDLKGWVTNTTPRNQLLAPRDVRVPNAKEFAGRGTLKFEPNEIFDAKLKFSANVRRGSGGASNSQNIFCPNGVEWWGNIDDCTADNRIAHGDPGPTFQSNPLTSRYGDGRPHLNTSLLLGSYEMNYHPNDVLTLTSVSGLFTYTVNNVDNFVGNYQPQGALPSANWLTIKEYSEELRLTSSFQGPFNFLIGGHYMDTTSKTGSNTSANALAPILVNNYHIEQRGKAWSLFAQGRFDVTPTIEFSGGARYSHEEKNLPVVLSGATFPPPPVVTPNSHGSWNNLSPEATVAWRPSKRFTLFASYKYGFLSGGFNSGASSFAADLKYNQQNIRGAEVGAKGLFLNGRLRTNLSVYDYVVTGLQVTTSVASSGFVQQLVTNAGKVKITGTEFDFNYAFPEIEGFSVHGAAAYNRARYSVFSVTCYRGQTQSQGCNQGVPVGGLFPLENLAGAQLVRAPDWVGGGGFALERPIGSNFKAGLTTDAMFTGGYYTDASNNPNVRQKGYLILDSTVHFGPQSERWEFSVIGRNLTNSYYISKSNTATFTGTPAGGVTGLLGDGYAYVSRGREIMLRLSLKTGGV